VGPNWNVFERFCFIVRDLNTSLNYSLFYVIQLLSTHLVSSHKMYNVNICRSIKNLIIDFGVQVDPNCRDLYILPTVGMRVKK